VSRITSPGTRPVSSRWLKRDGTKSSSRRRSKASSTVAIVIWMSPTPRARFGTTYARSTVNCRSSSLRNVTAAAPHVVMSSPRRFTSRRLPDSGSRRVSTLPRRYVSRLRWSALRARPVVASFDAPLNGTSDGIITAR
jgi:hypothetical protein